MHAQEDSRPESFERQDPYSRGEREAFDRARYISLGPFPWCEGWTTDAIERELGQGVLWVETEHFRIGSTLATYKPRADRIEKKRIEEEVARLKELFPGTKPSPARLDPWLRLHLYARRIEAVHAAFRRDFGVEDADFGEGRADGPPRIAPGPHLGMPAKFTVLLCERRSTLARFVRLALDRQGTDPIRERLPGETLFFGISMEAVRSWGHELDAALHAQVAANVALNLIDGFRNQGTQAPIWFKYGWSHVVSRNVDERFTLYARGAARDEPGAERWDPRVQALIGNGFAPTWKEMAEWDDFADLTGPAHMVAWSKLSWMLTLGPEAMRGCLMALTEAVPEAPAAERAEHLRARQLQALEALAGSPVPEAEETWRTWASKPPNRR